MLESKTKKTTTSKSSSKKSFATTKGKTGSRTSLKKANKDALDEILDKHIQVVPQQPANDGLQDLDSKCLKYIWH